MLLLLLIMHTGNDVSRLECQLGGGEAGGVGGTLITRSIVLSIRPALCLEMDHIPRPRWGSVGLQYSVVRPEYWEAKAKIPEKHNKDNLP